jgi:hypothetical protein
MKKLTTLLLFFIALSATSQWPGIPTGDTGFTTFTMGEYGFCDSFSCIWFPLKGNGPIRIEGDTMKAIAYMYKMMRENDSIVSEMYRFMGTTINYLNELPDYWRTKQGNCKWPQMYAVLKKNGYGIVKRKTAVYKPGCK